MPIFRTLRVQLSATFLGFLVLVGGSVTATFLAVQAQADDARLINLAGRQRMLTQQMTRLALTQPDNPELHTAIQLFDQTLLALRIGGPTLDPAGQTVTLPAAPDPALRAELDQISRSWVAFRQELENGDRSALQSESSAILAHLDSIVDSYETRARNKLVRLQLIQIVFLIAALLLLTQGYVLTRRHIVQPLAILGAATRRMAAGQLSEAVTLHNNDELGDLAADFEAMRIELAAARTQLEHQVARRTRELEAAFEFSQEIVAQLNAEHLLSSVANRTQTLMHASAVSLCLLTPDGGNLELVASRGEADYRTGLRQSVRHGLAAQVVGDGETVVVEAACSSCGFLQVCGPGQGVAAPLRVGAQTLGALCAVRSSGSHFDLDEVRALTLLANSAAIALVNARLAEAGQRQAELAAAATEREHLAAELHDNLAQTLSFLRLKVERAREGLAIGQAVEAELERMIPAIDQAYGQVRAALVGLRQSPLCAEDFAPKLKACVTDFSRDTGLSIELVIAEPATLALPPVVQTQALHIVREALTNVRRHARASHVWVRVDQANGSSCLTVEDDGCGFDPQAVEAEQHLGLVIMSTRAERSGGSLTIESMPGAGAKVLATFPLPPNTAGPSRKETIQ